MLPLLKLGVAAGALGNALVPPPSLRGQRLTAAPSVALGGGGYHMTRAEADAQVWQAEQAWRGGPQLGRTVAAVAVLGAVVWLGARKK